MIDLQNLFSPVTAQHRASLGSYMVLGTGRIQSSVPLDDMMSVVIYRKGDELWARREAEFYERFEIQQHPMPEGLGRDPMQDGDRGLEAAEARLRLAYTLQQPFAPDQTALVWRVDLGAIRRDLLRQRTLAEMYAAENAKLKVFIQTFSKNMDDMVEAHASAKEIHQMFWTLYPKK